MALSRKNAASANGRCPGGRAAKRGGLLVATSDFGAEDREAWAHFVQLLRCVDNAGECLEDGTDEPVTLLSNMFYLRCISPGI